MCCCCCCHQGHNAGTGAGSEGGGAGATGPNTTTAIGLLDWARTVAGEEATRAALFVQDLQAYADRVGEKVSDDLQLTIDKARDEADKTRTTAEVISATIGEALFASRPR